MKILIVCSGTNQQIAPFIQEQVDSLHNDSASIHYFLIRNKGISGYLRALPELRLCIRQFEPDIVHAHYGLSGLLANLQRKVPVVTTFHGSDINDPSVRKWSRWAIRLSRHSIFVSQQAIDITGVRKNFSLLPCGVDTRLFCPVDKQDARKQLGWDPNTQYILFAGSKDNQVKNYPLAYLATQNIENSTLVELKNYTRKEVSMMMNAADIALMTSFSEGSPQFIKEAMACNCPVVSTDVGDVSDMTNGIAGCYITNFDVQNVNNAILQALQFAKNNGRTQGRLRIEETGLTLDKVASKLQEIYSRSIHGAK